MTPSPAPSAFPLVAFALLTVGLQLSPGLLRTASGQVAANTWLGLVLVLTALGLALAAACGACPKTAGDGFLTAGLGLVLALELLEMLHGQPSYYRQYPEYDPWLTAFRAGVGLLILVAGSYACRTWPWPSLRAPVFLGIYAVLGAWVILTADRKPAVDVWLLQQNACAYLLQGKDPYAAEYPQFYGNNASDFLSSEQLRDGKIQSVPYPPLSLLMALPGFCLGDVRWSGLAALIGTAALGLATGRRLGLPAGHSAELAVLVFLCQPHGLLVLEVSWTEPYLAFALMAGLWSLAGQQRLIGLCLGAIVAMKQYAVLALPALWASGKLTGRRLGTGLVIAGLTALPFLLWHPAAFWLGVVGFHLHSPFRADSLSIPAVVATTTGYQLPPALGFLAAGVVAGLIAWRQKPGLANIALGSAATFLTFFVLNKAAHLNYYWLPSTLLAVAVYLSTAEALSLAVQPPCDS